jgi:hypothetical protein
MSVGADLPQTGTFAMALLRKGPQNLLDKCVVFLHPKVLEPKIIFTIFNI